MVSGTGTSKDPFILSSLSDLELIGTTGYALSAYYKLGANIDASGTSDPGYNSGAGWLPIGTSDAPFTGGFDGNNKTISNLYINRSSTNYVGLFGYTNTSTSANNIKNFTLSNPDITGQNYVGAVFGQQGGDITGITVQGGSVDGTLNVGGISGQTATSGTGLTSCTVSSNTAITNTGNYTGGILGYASVSTTFTGNSATASITGTAYVGGMIGGIAGSQTITSCTVNSTIYGTSYVGGVLGYKLETNNATIINTCTVNITLTNTGNYTGGLVGFQGGRNVSTDLNGSSCTITGTITSSGNYVGGVCGSAVHLVQNFTITSSLTFSVSSSDYVGGICGYIGSPACNIIKNCVVKTNITGRDYIGGIVGGSPNSNVCSIVYQNAYNGNISGRDYVGGVFGSNLGTNVWNSLYKCYSNGTVTASGTGAGGLIGRQGGYGISNCYSTATVSAPNGIAGGLIGRCNSNCPTYSYCYSKGAVSGSTAGGLTGYGTPTATSCYWDTQTSGQATSTIGTGKTTAEMKTQSTFTNWDFSTPIWLIQTLVNDGYPYLSGNFYNIISLSDLVTGADEIDVSTGGGPTQVSLSETVAGADIEAIINYVVRILEAMEDSVEAQSIKNRFGLDDISSGITNVYPIHNFLDASGSGTILEYLDIVTGALMDDSGSSEELIEFFMRIALLESAFCDDEIALTVYTLLSDYGSASEKIRQELLKIIGSLIFIKQKSIELEFTNEKTFDVER